MDSEQVASKASLLVFLFLYVTCTASGLHHPKGTVSGGLYPGARLAQREIDAVSKPSGPSSAETHETHGEVGTGSGGRRKLQKSRVQHEP